MLMLNVMEGIMKDSVLIDKQNFAIEEIDNKVVVDKALARTISLLNQKGYYVEMASKAKISIPLTISDFMQSLFSEKLLEVNDETEAKLKKVLNLFGFSSTLIIFKDTYEFNNLPEGFKLIKNDLLFYDLNILKNSDGFEIKSAIELDKENQLSLQLLEEWAYSLPNRN